MKITENKKGPLYGMLCSGPFPFAGLDGTYDFFSWSLLFFCIRRKKMPKNHLTNSYRGGII